MKYFIAVVAAVIAFYTSASTPQDPQTQPQTQPQSLSQSQSPAPAQGIEQVMDLPAQRHAYSVRTNVLSDAFANVNLGAAMSLSPRWSIGIEGDVNFWNMGGGKKWKHWQAMPEVRRWWCDNTSGSFLLAHAVVGQFNVGHIDMDFKFLGTDFSLLKDNRFQGWMGGLGVGYGYSWLLGRHWNLEALLAAGWIFTRYDQYNCVGCGRKTRSNVNHNYFGLTKAAFNLVYTF